MIEYMVLISNTQEKKKEKKTLEHGHLIYVLIEEY